jgi:hypothetical protein
MMTLLEASRLAPAESAPRPRVQLPPRQSWERMEPDERIRIAEASSGLIDPRVARHGGSRLDRRSNYDFPRMREEASWRRTEVHRATRFYGCSLCGQKFTGPHAVYSHLAKRHGR